MLASSQTKISVKVQPNAAKNEIVGLVDEVLRIRIARPPDKDKANKELVAFLSERLGLSKSSLSIVKGRNSRNKIIALEGLSQAEIIKRLFPTQ